MENNQTEKGYWDKIFDLNRAEEKKQKEALDLDAEIRTGEHDLPNPPEEPTIPEPEFNQEEPVLNDSPNFETKVTTNEYSDQESSVPIPDDTTTKKEFLDPSISSTGYSPSRKAPAGIKNDRSIEKIFPNSKD